MRPPGSVRCVAGQAHLGYSPDGRLDHLRDAKMDPPDDNENMTALVHQAAGRRKKIDRAARVAKSSSIVTLIIGGLGLVVTLLSWDWSGLLISLAICAVGATEWVGYKRMRQAMPAAAKLLGANQLAFAGVITLYCLVKMLTFSTEQVKAAALSPEFRSQLSAMPSLQKSIDTEIDQWAPLVTYGFYSLVIVLSVGFQGGLALYYFSRRKYIESFNDSTPKWVRELLAEARR